MVQAIMEKRWTNSVGEVDGWSFKSDGSLIHWTYDALFDGETGERSRGSADFDLESFKEFLRAFERNGTAKLIGREGAFVEMRRVEPGKVVINIRASSGIGCSSEIDTTEREGAIPLDVGIYG